MESDSIRARRNRRNHEFSSESPKVNDFDLRNTENEGFHQNVASGLGFARKVGGLIGDNTFEK